MKHEAIVKNMDHMVDEDQLNFAASFSVKRTPVHQQVADEGSPLLVVKTATQQVRLMRDEVLEH